MVVISASLDPGQRDYRVLYNPKVLALTEEMAGGPEGSVSMPGSEVQIVRPIWAEVGYFDDAGVGHSERLAGLTGRIAQHEIDQMNGIFFLDGCRG